MLPRGQNGAQLFVRSLLNLFFESLQKVEIDSETNAENDPSKLIGLALNLDIENMFDTLDPFLKSPDDNMSLFSDDEEDNNSLSEETLNSLRKPQETHNEMLNGDSSKQNKNDEDIDDVGDKTMPLDISSSFNGLEFNKQSDFAVSLFHDVHIVFFIFFSVFNSLCQPQCQFEQHSK